ncbi:MAG: hypothetical protein A3H93_09170 [Rhodocyclales bacterium RIFCSPLOWO2_02_FULL_63_24]|nr:MAG: hypothetical protein A3H93_09170 [Rhodocyclales bacterium RIFCSPLOWO2_02_FULL_63_24]
MNYAEARGLIGTGDLVAVRSHRGGLSAITRVVTQSPYTHTAVAIWLGARLLLAEMNGGGACLVPASKYADTDFDVFACPVHSTEAEGAIFDLLGLDIGYDFGDLLRIAQHELLGRPLPAADDKDLICSALSASIYLHAGLPRSGLPSIPSPRDVAAWMGVAPTLEVRR